MTRTGLKFYYQILTSIILVTVFSIPTTVGYAADGTISLISIPVDIDFTTVALGLPTTTAATQMTFFGVEYRNTSDNDGSTTLSEGDTAAIDGLLTATSFISGGSVFVPAGMNETWELTGTYTAIKDTLLPTGLPDTHLYIVSPGVGILSLFVSTDMSLRASSETGLGYDDGTMVAQFAVASGGGVYHTATPFDGSRDMIMLKQSGLDGFFTPEITGLIYDSNLDADPENDGLGGNSTPPTA